MEMRFTDYNINDELSGSGMDRLTAERQGCP